jgi:Cdc6-like AAA superfamily ATPase
MTTESFQSKGKQKKGKFTRKRINSPVREIPMEQEHEKLRKKYLKSIGCWFFETEQYQRWLDGDCSVLVCPGIPGSGKTMLASEVVHRLNDRSRSQDVNGPIGVAFAYLKKNFGEDDPAFELMKQLLGQLIRNCPWSDLLHDTEAWITCTPLSLGDVTALAREVGRSYRQVYIIIDALDELNLAQKGVNELVTSLQGLQDDFGAKLLYTLRNVPDVIEQLREDGRIEVQAKEEDVSTIVDRGLQNIDGRWLGEKLHSETLRHDLKKSMVLSSKNM